MAKRLTRVTRTPTRHNPTISSLPIVLPFAPVGPVYFGVVVGLLFKVETEGVWLGVRETRVETISLIVEGPEGCGTEDETAGVGTLFKAAVQDVSGEADTVGLGEMLVELNEDIPSGKQSKKSR